MYDNNIENIEKAKNGDEKAMTELVENNKRTYMEYSKKILFKRIWDRRFIPNRLYGIYKIYKKIWYKLWGKIINICSTIHIRRNKKIHKRWSE